MTKIKMDLAGTRWLEGGSKLFGCAHCRIGKGKTHVFAADIGFLMRKECFVCWIGEVLFRVSIVLSGIMSVCLVARIIHRPAAGMEPPQVYPAMTGVFGVVSDHAAVQTPFIPRINEDIKKINLNKE